MAQPGPIVSASSTRRSPDARPAQPTDFCLRSAHGYTTPTMFSVILFGVIAVLMAIDVTIEIRSGVPLGLESFELVIFLLALGGIAIHWWRLTEARAEVKRWTEDARRWNQEAQDILQGLGVAIDRQFDRWGLSPAEREIALVGRQGLSDEETGEDWKTTGRNGRQLALSDDGNS